MFGKESLGRWNQTTPVAASATATELPVQEQQHRYLPVEVLLYLHNKALTHMKHMNISQTIQLATPFYHQTRAKREDTG